MLREGFSAETSPGKKRQDFTGTCICGSRFPGIAGIEIAFT